MAWSRDTPVLASVLQPRAEALATLLHAKPEAYLWAQTLQKTEMIQRLLELEQRCGDDVQVAMMEGILCPAMIELICEALENPGREPKRLKA